MSATIGAENSVPIQAVDEAIRLIKNNDSSIFVQGKDIGPEGAQKIANALETFSLLVTSLSLPDCNIGDVGAAAIAGFLQNSNCKLKQVDLSSNGIGGEGAKAISQALQISESVTEMKLNGNQLGDDGIEVIATVLARNKTLQYVHLEGNNIGDDGALFIFRSLVFNKTLTYLNVDNNRISPNLKKKILESVSKNSKNSGVQFQFPPISPNIDQTANQLAEVDQNKDFPLSAEAKAALDKALQAIENKNNESSVRLWGEKIGDAGAQQIAKALEGNKTVLSLQLTDCNVGDVGAAAIAGVLQHVNCTLKKVDLSDNEIGDNGAQSLSKALQNNGTLTKIDLSKNNIGDNGAQAIAKSLECNDTLTSISLHDNHIRDNGSQALVNAMNLNFTITSIGLETSSQPLSPTIINEISRILEENERLQQKLLRSKRTITILLKNDTVEPLKLVDRCHFYGLFVEDTIRRFPNEISIGSDVIFCVRSRFNILVAGGPNGGLQLQGVYSDRKYTICWSNPIVGPVWGFVCMDVSISECKTREVSEKQTGVASVQVYSDLPKDKMKMTITLNPFVQSAEKADENSQYNSPRSKEQSENVKSFLESVFAGGLNMGVEQLKRRGLVSEDVSGSNFIQYIKDNPSNVASGVVLLAVAAANAKGLLSPKLAKFIPAFSDSEYEDETLCDRPEAFKKVVKLNYDSLPRGPMPRATFTKHLKRLNLIGQGDDVDACHLIAAANGGADHSDNFAVGPMSSSFNRSAVNVFDDLQCYFAGLKKTKRAIAASREFGSYDGPDAEIVFENGKQRWRRMRSMNISSDVDDISNIQISDVPKYGSDLTKLAKVAISVKASLIAAGVVIAVAGTLTVIRQLYCRSEKQHEQRLDENVTSLLESLGTLQSHLDSAREDRGDEPDSGILSAMQVVRSALDKYAKLKWEDANDNRNVVSKFFGDIGSGFKGRYIEVAKDVAAANQTLSACLQVNMFIRLDDIARDQALWIQEMLNSNKEFQEAAKQNFETLQEHVNSLNHSFNGLSSIVGDINSKLDRLTKIVEGIDEKVNSLHQKFDIVYGPDLSE